MKLTTIWSTVALAASTGALGYEIETHLVLSKSAVQNSILATSDYLSRVGLRPFDDRTQTFPSTGDTDPVGVLSGDCKHGTLLTIENLIFCGSQFEDVPSDRSLNHFFNPIDGSGLKALGITQNSSPDWALGDRGSPSGQLYSYGMARASFLSAFTSPSPQDRDAKWGAVFQTMGQVIHHLRLC